MTACFACSKPLSPFDGVGVDGRTFCPTCAPATSLTQQDHREQGTLAAQKIAGGVVLALTILGGLVSLFSGVAGAALLSCAVTTLAVFLVGQRQGWWRG